jgi:hypothetical protein
MIQAYTHFFKDSKPFTGEKKTYDGLPGTIDEPTYRGLRLVTTTVDEKLQYFEETQGEFIFASLSQEATNASGNARADLIVEGENWGSFSSLELLKLHSLIENGELEKMYDSIPTRDESKRWEACTEDMYKDRSIVQSPVLLGKKHTTTKESYILPDPNLDKLKDTSKYQPSVAEKTTPVHVGDYTVQEFSGQWSARQKAGVLRRRTILLSAITEALKKANEAEAVASKLLPVKLFNYLHRGIN